MGDKIFFYRKLHDFKNNYFTNKSYQQDEI